MNVDNSSNLEIGKRVKEIRSSLNLSQIKFGEKINLSPTMVSKIEMGERTLTQSTLSSLNIAYGCNIDYILYGTGDLFSDNCPLEALRQLTIRYDLSDIEIGFITSYFNLPKKDREVIQNLLHNFIKAYLSDKLH